MGANTKFSLRYVLIAGILGLQLIAITAILVSSYYNTAGALRRDATRLMVSLSERTITHVEAFLAPARTDADLTGSLIQSGVFDTAEVLKVERYFLEQLRAYPSIAGLYYGDIDGNFLYVKREGAGQDTASGGDSAAVAYLTKIIAHADGARTVSLVSRDSAFGRIGSGIRADDPFDPRTRTWFMEALAAERSVWTDLYIFFTSGGPGISAAMPVSDDGEELIGAVGVDIELTALSDFLGNLRNEESSTAFILHRNGDVIAFPDIGMLRHRVDSTGETLRFIRISELEDPVARAAFDALGGDLGFESRVHTAFSVGGAGYLGVASPLQDERWPWIVGVYLAEADYLGATIGSQKGNILIALVIAAFSGGAGLIIWRSIAGPIAVLGADAIALREGNFDVELKAESRYRETDELVKSFREMVSGLKERDSKNKLLTQDLRKFAQAVEQSPVGIFITTPECRVEYINPAFTALTGYTKSDAVGRQPPEFAAEYREQGRYEALLNVVTRGGIWRAEVSAETKDGQPYDAVIVIAPILNTSGTATNCVGIVEDVTEQARRERELRVARYEADRANEAKTDFLAHMSHQLRTPLNGIVGAVEAFRSKMFGPLGAPRYDEYADDIYASAQQLSDLVTNLLDLSKMELGSWQSDDEIVDIDAVLHDVVELLARGHRDVSDRIHLRIEEALPSLRINSRALQQILFNLLSNALKFTPASGEISATANMASDGSLSIIISDTGRGMDADALAASREVFGAGGSQIARVREGARVGLPLTQRLVESHDGTLEIHSAKDRGTTVTVWFPAERLVSRRRQRV